MKTFISYCRRRFSVALAILIGAILLAAPYASAAVPNINGDDPKITTDNTPFIAWTMVVVFALGVLGISFKTSKRTLR